MTCTYVRVLFVSLILLPFVQVPAPQFPGYVASLVEELYAPLRAAVKGTLAGEGTLGTVLMCETLLSFLPSGTVKDQPSAVLRAYDVAPTSALDISRRIDLRPYAKVREGVLYVARPAVEKMWVPLKTLPASARATAGQMLRFLGKLKSDRGGDDVIARAAETVVTQFRHDLLEMGVIASLDQLNRVGDDGRVSDILTAEEYAGRVFHPDLLPCEMATKSFLRMAVDLLDEEQLGEQIVAAVKAQLTLVPRTTVHARSATFSRSAFTLLTDGELSLGLSSRDADRLLTAAAPLFEDYFSEYGGPRERKKVFMSRPRLRRCVRKVVDRVRRRTGLPSTRNLLAVTCATAVALADREKVLPVRPNFGRLSRATNLYRYVGLKEIGHVVRSTETESGSDGGDENHDEEDVTVTTGKRSRSRRRRRRTVTVTTTRTVKEKGSEDEEEEVRARGERERARRKPEQNGEQVTAGRRSKRRRSQGEQEDVTVRERTRRRSEETREEVEGSGRVRRRSAVGESAGGRKCRREEEGGNGVVPKAKDARRVDTKKGGWRVRDFSIVLDRIAVPSKRT